MSYTRVTNEERRLVYEWMQEGKGVRKIAELLKRAAGEVSEINASRPRTSWLEKHLKQKGDTHEP